MTLVSVAAACSSSSQNLSFPSAGKSKVRDVVDVFCLEDNGGIFRLRYQNGSWTRQHLDPPPARDYMPRFVSPICAASLDPDYVDLFGFDANNNVLHCRNLSPPWRVDATLPHGPGGVAAVWWMSGAARYLQLQLNVFRLDGSRIDSWHRGTGGDSEPWQGPDTMDTPIAGPLTAFNLADMGGTPFEIVGLDSSGKLVVHEYYAGWNTRREYDYTFKPGQRLIACVLASDSYNHTNIFEQLPNGQVQHHFNGQNGWQKRIYAITFPEKALNHNWTLMDCCDRSPAQADLFFLNQQSEVLRVALVFPKEIDNSTDVQITSELLLGDSNSFHPLDTFDHVVVLMLENRSFDNLLGYLYPQGVPANAPLGKTYEGIATAQARLGHALSNPVPDGIPNPPPPGSNNVIPVSAVDAGNYHCPYPDPGEEYPHINTQLFNTINGGDESPWNLPNPLPSPAPMTGFVRDYIENFKASEFPGKDPTYDDYRQIMQSYTPEAVPVLSQLATNFAVFDHWYCAVPSQTWCNRAFWNAGTSGGMVINPTIWTSVAWEQAGAQPTLFNQIHESGESSPLDWHVYTDETIMSLHLSLTGAIHAKALDDFHGPLFRKFFPLTPDFFTDCANGNLPAYSFLEPKFTTPHNDMHPSTPGGLYAEGQVGSVLLGELLVQQVYEAIRTSNTQKPGANNSQNTLLIITFDEHGGCYDHVDPPRGITPPDLSKFNKQDNFDFTRLGIRVPMIMVSAHIAKNTVVNTPMYHDSFLKTMEKKWNALLPGKFPYLSKRIEAAPEFTEVFTLATPRPASDWVVIDPPKIPPMKRDDPNAPLNPLDRTIVAAALAHQTPAVPQARSLSITAADTVNTVGEAEALLRAAGRTEADI